MKNLKLTPKITALSICTIMLFSCENTEELNFNETEEKSISNQEQNDLSKIGFKSNETTFFTSTLPDGTKSEYYLFNDMLLNKKALPKIDELLGIKTIENKGTKAFTTNFTVNGNRTYKIAFIDFVNAEHKKGCLDFIDEFNNKLQTTIKLEAVFVTPAEISNTPRDVAVWWENMVIDGNPYSFYAFAEFPTQYGQPGRNVRMNTNFAVDFNRTFMRSTLMHEFGHVFGLRHSDYKTRQSCGTTVGNEDNSIGENHIPFTDATGDNINSIMRACFDVGSDLKYLEEDLKTMRWMYGYKP